ncbi:hypothetical protein [Actinacidiphila yeochonensis]|uniref:hypothetical protein n=1 Tax=Actinacidiphila yeochonensis TaxID=89050 RepID=UPI0012FEDC6D|nr:hypothetical protein [Actinacidiphila yeochonensis]
MSTTTRGSVCGLAGALALAGALTLAAGGPAGAAPAGAGAWTETPTGQVSFSSLAQAGSVTWAGGDVIDTGSDSGSGFTPAMYRRDGGGAWQQVALDGADAWDSRINDIATTADGSGFLVGDQPTDSQTTGQGMLVGRYRGGSWHLESDDAPPAGTVDASLGSVSALNGHDAWAVGGGYQQDTWAQVPIVQHWNGRQWQPVTIPGSTDWLLTQVDEVAPDDVWVVGVDNDSGESVAVHWDGQDWTRTPTPQFADSSVLFDVVARTPDDVWAVGWSRDTDKQRPAGLALHWDGTAWSQVPLPDGTFALQSAALRPHGGLAVVGGNDDAAVGLSWTPAGGWQSLGLPENDPQLPLGVFAVASSGSHLTVSGWHYESSDFGDSFSSGVLLTR